jgi:uncharacterized membrane protein YhaH (DUF805 family)
VRRNIITFTVWVLGSVLILWGHVVLQVEVLRDIDYPWDIPVVLICTIVTVGFILGAGVLLNEWANPGSEDEDVE